MYRQRVAVGVAGGVAHGGGERVGARGGVVVRAGHAAAAVGLVDGPRLDLVVAPVDGGGVRLEQDRVGEGGRAELHGVVFEDRLVGAGVDHRRRAGEGVRGGGQ